ncbi:MAG TPA: mandelate racemase/muconate lactonizing enzyme family protein [Candidatus Bathyarchaeia archaeon]|nr:mandelate racemase/muconate lactonizing enzyme family protein [Candidatus Bathyarchaeia archaeon]
MKIKDIIATPLSSPNLDTEASDSSQDDVVVEVVTDEGIVGIGETDAPPTVVKAFIDMPSSHDTSVSLKRLLLGEDPLQIERLWNKMYQGTLMAGRRGLGIHAIGAIDMALWDIAGKYYDKPVWKLLGGAQKENATPYASLLTLQNPDDVERKELKRRVDVAKRKSFKVYKLEELVNSKKRDFELVKAAREAVGEDSELMVDAYYCWPNFSTALERCRELEQFHLYFIETPIHVDDVEGLRKLCDALDMKVATGEWLTTRYEFMDIIDRGKVDVAQPDIGRVGGLSEARKIADFAKSRGVMVVPHCWKTGIGIAASLHFCIATSNCPYFEFLVKELAVSRLRKDLIKKEFPIKDGCIEPPETPGLGIELDRKVMEKYEMKKR